MKHSFLKLSLMLAVLAGGAAYGWVLVDWLQDMKTGSYDSDPLQVICQTVVILAYCYVAYRFIEIRVNRSTHSLNYPETNRTSQDGQTQPTPWVNHRQAVPNSRQGLPDKPRPMETGRA